MALLAILVVVLLFCFALTVGGGPFFGDGDTTSPPAQGESAETTHTRDRDRPTDGPGDEHGGRPAAELIALPRPSEGDGWVRVPRSDVGAEPGSEDAARLASELQGPSARSEMRADVTLENTCDQVVEVLWIDFDGNERSYGRLAPSEHSDLGTFVGHNWHVRTLDGGFVRGLSAETGPAHWVTCDESHTATSAPGSAPAFDPDWPDHASPRTIDAADIAVENTCARAIELRWVDFDGTERVYATLEPNERWTQESFRGHLWRIFTSGGDAIGAFRAAPDAVYASCGQPDQ